MFSSIHRVSQWAGCMLFMLLAVSSSVWAEALKIAVSQTPLSSPFYVAHDQKLFDRYGLHVEFVNVVGGHRAMKAVLEGRADYATSSDMVITNAIRSNEEFVVLGSFVQSPEDAVLVTRKDTQITAIPQLKGKKIGITPRTSSHYFADTVLLLNGILPSEVTYIDVAPEDMQATLARGEVDAVATWQPWGLKTYENLGDKGVLLDEVQAYTLTFNLVGAKTGRAEKHAGAVLKALIAAEQFIQKHEAAAKVIVSKALDLTAQELDKIWDYYRFSVRLDQSLLVTIENEFRWRNTINPPALPMQNLLQFFNTRPLSEIDAGRVTLID